MDAHRVQVFHAADGDAVVFRIPQHFIFNFLPAGHAALDERLADEAVGQSFVDDIIQLVIVMGDAAAGAAQGISRTHDEGIPHLARKLLGCRHRFHDGAFRNGLVNLEHSFLKEFPVLGPLDGINLGT